MSTSAQAPTYQAPGSGAPRGQQGVQNAYGPPPSDPFQLQAWAQNVNRGSVSDWQNAAEGQSGATHVGLNGPVGSSGWTMDPNTGQWTQSQQFNGPLAGAATGYEQQIADQKPLDLSGLPQLNYGSGQMKTAEDAAYNQAKSRLDPQFAQQGEQLQSQLAAQGLDPGTEAANNAQGNFDRAKNDAYSSAQNYAVGQGLQAQQQAFGQSAMAQQQALSNLLTQRGMPAQQLQQLLGMMGGAQGVGQAQGPNYLGAMEGQAGFNLSNADMQNQLMGGGLNALGNAAGAAYKLSDERAKQCIERLPLEVHDGIPYAVFEYRLQPGKKHLGVIAQDVLRVLPHLVKKRADGLYCVNYGGLQ